MNVLVIFMIGFCNAIADQKPDNVSNGSSLQNENFKQKVRIFNLL